jgi:mono/diheme cytochrome c family protein
MRMKAAMFILLSSLVLTWGCASNRRDEPFTRAVDVSDPKVLLGQRVFYQNCNVCHPGGSAGYGPSLNAAAPADWYIKLRVRSGWGAMPAFDDNRLPDSKLDAVVAYLQALRS